MSDPTNQDARSAVFDRLRNEPVGRSDPVGGATLGDADGPSRDERGSVVVFLDFALGTRTFVTVTPPTFGDVEAVVEGAKSELEMHASMTGLTAEDFRRLRWPDAEKIIVVARHLAPELKNR